MEQGNFISTPRQEASGEISQASLVQTLPCLLDHDHRFLKHQCLPFLVYPSYGLENEHNPSPKWYSELFIIKPLPDSLYSHLKSLYCVGASQCNSNLFSAMALFLQYSMETQILCRISQDLWRNVI